jgi:hypothetical protein
MSKQIKIATVPVDPDHAPLEVSRIRYFQHCTGNQFTVLTPEFYRTYMFESPWRFSHFISTIRIYEGEMVAYGTTLWNVLNKKDEWIEVSEEVAMPLIETGIMHLLNDIREETL